MHSYRDGINAQGSRHETCTTDPESVPAEFLRLIRSMTEIRPKTVDPDTIIEEASLFLFRALRIRVPRINHTCIKLVGHAERLKLRHIPAQTL